MNSLRQRVQWLVTRAGTIAVPVLAIGALLAVLFNWSPRRSSQQTPAEIWTCSMHPQVQLSQHDRCPLCGMELIPISQFQSEQARIEQQAGIETEVVKYRELFKEIRTVGKLDFNERRMAYITARTDGRVDRVYADFTGITVKPNDHLVDIYSPTLYTAQAELLRSLDAVQAAGDRRFAVTNLESARTKLRLLGILPEQIAEIEKTRRETTHLTIYAPIGGVVVEKNVREQQYVKEGDMLYRIAELDPIWLFLNIYEYDLGWIRYGQSVDVTVEAYPGDVFRGTIVFIDPFLNDQTRTVNVRVNLKNPDYRLKPAMYASAVVHVRLRADGAPEPTGMEGKYICPMHPEVVSDVMGRCDSCGMSLELVPNLFPARPVVANETAGDADLPVGQVLAVRKSAVLDTGRRQVAYRKRPDGAYELVEVKLGSLADVKDDTGRTVNYYPVLAGLSAGDEVIIQGGFLLDSQRQIEGMPSLLYAEGRSAAGLHAGHGGQAGTSAAENATPATAPATSHKH
jgi:Cu(I)/Ag(I) efflux system membrane fusion protein